MIEREIEFRILECVQNHEAEWSWYQLDRALSRENPAWVAFLLPALKRLEEKEWIVVNGSSNSSMPRYSTTEKGREELADYQRPK